MAGKGGKDRRAGRAKRRASGGGLRGRLLRGAIWLAAVLAVGASTAFGLRSLESRVKTSEDVVAAPTAIRVRLQPPPWMPLSLARRIASGVVGPEADFNDPALVQQVHGRLAADPWVRSTGSVRKDRCDDPLAGILEIQAVFREPLAVVLLGGGTGFAFVDGEAVRLPDEANQPGAPRWAATVPASADRPARQLYCWDRSEVPQGLDARPVHYILLEGVQADPPAPGRRWEGADVADGVRLAQLLREKPYADQVLSVDVRNHGGRLMGNSGRPHIVIRARGRSGEAVEIWFGRFPAPRGDYVLSVERRLENLDEYIRRYGGAFGAHRRVDLQYDRVHVE